MTAVSRIADDVFFPPARSLYRWADSLRQRADERSEPSLAQNRGEAAQRSTDFQTLYKAVPPMTGILSEPLTSHRIYYIPSDDYLSVSVNGDMMDFERTRQIMRETADKCLVHGYRKVLQIVNVEEQASVIDMFLIITDFWRVEHPEIAMAIVDKFRDHHETNEFVNNVAANWSIKLRIFDNIHDAKRWLATF